MQVDADNYKETRDNLENCLKLITEIRSGSWELWKSASEGTTAAQGEDGPPQNKKFLSELKVKLDTVAGKINELNSNLSNGNSVPANHMTLGNSLYLSMDTSLDNVPVYTNLLNSYKWMNKTHEFSSKAVNLLSQNPLSRSYVKVAKNKRRITNTSHTAPPGTLDNLITNVGRMYGAFNFTVSRSNGTKLNAIVEVKLERVLKAVLVFKGLMIEWVVVRAYNEDSNSGGGQPDVWSPSRYAVFRKITENANAAMLNFQSIVYPEMAVRSFMTYFHSYISLFTDKCKKCNYHLHNNLPPTWREFKTLEPFHEDCRPSL